MNPITTLLAAVRDGDFEDAVKIAHDLHTQLNARTVTKPEHILASETELAVSDQEAFVVFALTCRNRLLRRIEISRGGISTSIVDLRIVFRRLLEANADSFIALHNHPSGEPDPSLEDLDITHQLQAAGKLIGITLTDHIIVALNGFYSFRSHARL